MRFTPVSRAALASLAALAFAPAQAQTVFTTSAWVPPTHTLTMAQKEWCDILEKNTAGKMKCNALPRAVSAPPGTYDAVKDGLADISFTVHGYTPSRFIATKVAEFAFLGNSPESNSVAFNRVASKHPAFAAEHAGVKVLAYFTHGPGIAFNTKKAITKADDFSGLKFRVGGGFVNDLAKGLGINTTLKPATEAYELISSGVMDGTLFPAESIASFKLDKFIKHATTFPGGMYNTSFVFLMNQAKYDKLSADDKKAVDAISGEFAARMFGKGWDRVDKLGFDAMKAAGVQINQADAAFVNAVKAKSTALEEVWAKDAEAKGLKDAKKLLADLRAEIASLEK